MTHDLRGYIAQLRMAAAAHAHAPANTGTHETVPDGGWLVIHEETLLGLLRAARAGLPPDDLYAELYAHMDHNTEGNG